MGITSFLLPIRQVNRIYRSGYVHFKYVLILYYLHVTFFIYLVIVVWHLQQKRWINRYNKRLPNKTCYFSTRTQDIICMPMHLPLLYFATIKYIIETSISCWRVDIPPLCSCYYYDACTLSTKDHGWNCFTLVEQVGLICDHPWSCFTLVEQVITSFVTIHEVVSLWLNKWSPHS